MSDTVVYILFGIGAAVACNILITYCEWRFGRPARVDRTAAPPVTVVLPANPAPGATYRITNCAGGDIVVVARLEDAR